MSEDDAPEDEPQVPDRVIVFSYIASIQVVREIEGGDEEIDWSRYARPRASQNVRVSVFILDFSIFAYYFPLSSTFLLRWPPTLTVRTASWSPCTPP